MADCEKRGTVTAGETFRPQAMVPEMDYDHARLSLVLEGDCPLCGRKTAIELVGLSPGETVPCHHCNASLNPDCDDVKRLGRDLVMASMDRLEERLGPWPEFSHVRKGTIFNFDCHSILFAYLEDVEVGVEDQNELSLVMHMTAALKPWLHVRFGAVQSAFFGHLTINVEDYLCEREVGVTPSDTFDVFCHEQMVSNQYLKEKWDALLTTSQGATFLSAYLPRESPHASVRSLFNHNGNDAHQTWHRSKVHLTLTDAEHDRARMELERMGVPAGAEYVCMGERSASYRKQVYADDKWMQHLASRDSDFDQYALAAEALAERGYYVLRMGAAVDRKLEDSHPAIIDYASKHRSEFMDIYLGATCRFFVTPASGVSSVASICRRPIVFTDFYFMALAHHWMDNIIFLPPHLYRAKTGDHMPLAEYCRLRPPAYGLEQLGINYRPNSGEEVLQACLEMDDRLSGQWDEAPEDAELQARFKKQIEWYASGLKGMNGGWLWTEGASFLARAGAAFLRENPDFLAEPDRSLRPSFVRNRDAGRCVGENVPPKR